VPVTLRTLGDMVMLNFQDSSKYAGVINQPFLCKILEKENVKFVATLTTSPLPKDQERNGEKKKYPVKPQDCSVRIVIYGLFSERSVVGDMLSSAGLYLQQPSVSECDRNTEYSNPHYLIRPGSNMPRLEDLSIHSDIRNITTSERLDEVNRNRLSQLFDTANDSGIRSQITPSPRLCSSLKE
jgi:hypothetical protein